MGTFVGLYSDEEAYIPDDRLEEFEERLEKVLWAGGMMSVEKVSMFGIDTAVLQKVKRQENGDMEFWYNYFEQDSWESAGYDSEKRRVWSGKVEWSKFYNAMLAAYVLQGIYTEGITATKSNGQIVNDMAYVGWFNYLFNEEENIKNHDTWPVFVQFHKPETYYYEWTDNYPFGRYGYGYICQYEIMAVEKGIDYVLENIEPPNKSFCLGLAYEGIQELITIIRKYVKESVENDKFSVLMKLVKECCKESFKEYNNNYEGDLKEIKSKIHISDSPVIALKVISEEFDKDFWELWAEIKDVYKRQLDALYGAENSFAIPHSTEEFFRLEPDDMIPYWEEDGDIEPSKEFWKFTKSLKKKYEEIMKTEFQQSFSIKHILEIMKSLYCEYARIMVFEDFFNDTINHMEDKRFLALWKICEDMMKDPELIKKVNELYENNGAICKDFRGRKGKILKDRCLNILGKGAYRNEGREKLRKYIALVGNEKLRKKVFGF